MTNRSKILLEELQGLIQGAREEGDDVKIDAFTLARTTVLLWLSLIEKEAVAREKESQQIINAPREALIIYRDKQLADLRAEMEKLAEKLRQIPRSQMWTEQYSDDANKYEVVEAAELEACIGEAEGA